MSEAEKPKKKRKYKYPKERGPDYVPRKGTAKLYKVGKPTRPSATSYNIKPGNQLSKGISSADMESLANKRIDASLVARYITANSHLSEPQLRERLKDSTISIFEKRIIKSLLGEDSALSFQYMVERLAGKIVERHVHEVANKYSDMTTEELLAEKRRLEEQHRVNIDYAELERGMRVLEEAPGGAIEVEATEATSEAKPEAESNEG